MIQDVVKNILLYKWNTYKYLIYDINYKKENNTNRNIDTI